MPHKTVCHLIACTCRAAAACPRRRRSLALVASLAVVAGPLVALAPAASAGTGTACNPGGTPTCNNLDPTQSYNLFTGTECDDPAQTVGQTPAFGGTLQLRWGPSCVVNWTRFIPASSGTYMITTKRLSTGVTTTYTFNGQPGVPYYDNEVYAPDAAQACVTEKSGATWLPKQCFTQ